LESGVIGIGNVGGVNVYDAAGGITDSLVIGQTNVADPVIQGYTGN